VLLGGINSFRLLRLVVEAEHWAERLEGGNGVLLKQTRSLVVRKIGEREVGKVTDPEEKVDLLLKEVEGYAKVRVRSIAWANMPERMSPLSMEDEVQIVKAMVSELRDNFGVRVSGNLIHIRDRIEGLVKVYKYGVLGASNAGKLGEALKSKGKDVVVVAKGGWRPSKQGVEELLKEMEGKISEDRIVIFYGMDNAVFYEEDEDGDRSLPKPDDKKVYHVKGKVELATEKQAKALMANCKPVMDKAEGNRKLVLSPGVRFYRETCCQVESHCVNAGEEGYRKGMLRIWCESGWP
jgi:hypothetical protein